MAVFRIEKTRDYTVMANHHLKNKNLSLKAKGLLSVILSLPDNWNYTTRGLSAICKEGVDSIGGALKELETAGYILRNRLRDDKGRITDTEYIIYETPTPSPQPHPTAPETADPHTAAPYTENPYMDEPDTGMPAQLNTYRENTYPENTQTSNIHLSNQSMIDQREMEQCKARVQCRIDYDALLEDSTLNAAQLDEIVALMTETLCSNKPIISVAGEEYPADVVKSRLASLTSDHIEYVMLCLKKTTTPVRNIRKYLLTALFNAPVTMESYFTAAYNHHRYQSALVGGGKA